MKFTKEKFIAICIGLICIGAAITALIAILLVCLVNGWGYYYFDVIAKSSPAFAGLLAYYIWSKNRDKEIKELEYRNDYYKKIINERMETYKEFAELLFLINRITCLAVNGVNNYYHMLFKNTENMQKIMSQIEITAKKNIWLDDQALSLLHQFNMLIVSARSYIDNINQNEIINYFSVYEKEEYAVAKQRFDKIYDKYDEIILSDEELKLVSKEPIKRNSIILGMMLFDDVNNLCKRGHEIIYQDMLNLEKVDTFLENKRKQEK